MKRLLLLTLFFVSCSGGTQPQPGPLSPETEEARLISNVRQLTFAGKRSGEGYFNADGSKLIFQSERTPENPFYQMYVSDLVSGASRQVSTGKGKTTCGWFHPREERVLFSSTDHDPNALRKQREELELRNSGKERRYAWDYDDEYEIYTRELRGVAPKGLKRLTTARGYDAEASWSPSGRKILFASNRHAYAEKLSGEDAELLKKDASAFVELYLMNSDGSGLQRLTHNKVYDGGPFFGSSDQHIIWRRFNVEGSVAEVYVGNLNERQELTEKQCTELGAVSWAPFFHPQGDYFIFTTSTQGFDNFELYVSRTDCSKQARVTFTPGFDGLPVFSPNGAILSWSSKRSTDHTAQIFAGDWNDAAARKALDLRHNGAVAEPPAKAMSQFGLELKDYVGALTGEEMHGRMTGTEGEANAAAWAIGVLKEAGFEPAGDDGTYGQKFEFTAGVALGQENFLAAETAGGVQNFVVGKDWVPLSFSSTGPAAETELVFAGYGIVAPELVAPDGQKFPEYDSYVHLDVKDKWVLVLRQAPDTESAELQRHLQQHASLRYKAMLARERGARGLLVASGPLSKVRNQLVPLAYDASQSGSGIFAASITDNAADKLLSGGGRSLEELQAELDQAELAQGFGIPGTKLAARIEILQEKRHGYNVLARLKGSRSGSLPAIAIGAHLDHLGDSVSGSSLARENERGQVHPGADDNASGVSAVLGIARAVRKSCITRKCERDLLIALWSGEELGLLGSDYFTKSPPAALKKMKIGSYLNLDMVGRLRNNRLIVQGVASGDSWLEQIEQANAPLGLAIIAQGDSYLPTDATSFYLNKIPILSGFTGVHEEYHTPRDTPDKLNYPGLETVAKLFLRLTEQLLRAPALPEYRKQDKPANFGRRANLRAYLGTIPDYGASEVKGVKLSGVSSNSPAERAGLQRADVVVQLAGKRIENIYDYTFAIEALKVGQTVGITIQREGDQLDLQITPASRE